MKGQGQGTNARSVSFEVPGWREMRRRDRASIWSRDRFTEGRSGRERWEVRFLDDVNSDERSEVIAVQNQNNLKCHKPGSSLDYSKTHYEQPISVAVTTGHRFIMGSPLGIDSINTGSTRKLTPKRSLYTLLNNAMTRDSDYDMSTEERHILLWGQCDREER